MNAAAPRNMWAVLVTFDVFHEPMGSLNAAASMNMAYMPVTRAVSQEPMG